MILCSVNVRTCVKCKGRSRKIGDVLGKSSIDKYCLQETRSRWKSVRNIEEKKYDVSCFEWQEGVSVFLGDKWKDEINDISNVSKVIKAC